MMVRGLAEAPYSRIEVLVDPAFAPAIRWIRLLGFACETPYKPYYLPDGRAAGEWVMLK